MTNVLILDIFTCEAKTVKTSKICICIMLINCKLILSQVMRFNSTNSGEFRRVPRVAAQSAAWLAPLSGHPAGSSGVPCGWKNQPRLVGPDGPQALWLCWNTGAAPGWKTRRASPTPRVGGADPGRAAGCAAACWAAARWTAARWAAARWAAACWVAARWAAACCAAA